MRGVFLLLGIGLSLVIIFDSYRKNRLYLGYFFAFLSIMFPLLGIFYFMIPSKRTPTSVQQSNTVLCSKCGSLNEPTASACASCNNTLAL